MQHNKTNSKNTKVALYRWGRPWECCTREGLKTVLDSWFLAEDRFVAQWHVCHCIVCCMVTSYHYCLLYPYISLSKDICWLHKLQWPQIHCRCDLFHGIVYDGQHLQYDRGTLWTFLEFRRSMETFPIVTLSVPATYIITYSTKHNFCSKNFLTQP